MSKEVKFRAWDGKKLWSWEDMKNCLGFIHWFKEGVELMQYIGRKDKNNVDVYESDLIKYLSDHLDDEIYEVVYSECTYLAKSINFPEDDLSLLFGFEIQVIGNIHDK